MHGRGRGRLRRGAAEPGQRRQRRQAVPDWFSDQDVHRHGDPPARPRGELALSDPVSRYQPRVPNGRQNTIEQLMTMRSGLLNYTLSRQLNRTIDVHPSRAFTPGEVLKIVVRARRHPVPGREFEYSNTNTVLLGLDHRAARRTAAGGDVLDPRHVRLPGSSCRFLGTHDGVLYEDDWVAAEN